MNKKKEEGKEKYTEHREKNKSVHLCACFGNALKELFDRSFAE